MNQAKATRSQHLISSYSDRMARAAENRERILRFLISETFTTPELVRVLLGASSIESARRALKALEKTGFVRAHDLPVLVGRPIKIYGVTQAGIDALDWDGGKARTFQPSKVTISTLQHTLDRQLARIRAERSGWTKWVRDVDFAGKGFKKPDAIATDQGGALVAVEIERTVKAKKRYAEIIKNHLQAIRQGRYARVLYLCPDEGLASIQRAITSIDVIQHGDRQIKLTEQHWNYFQFASLEGDQWLE